MSSHGAPDPLHLVVVQDDPRVAVGLPVWCHVAQVADLSKLAEHCAAHLIDLCLLPASVSTDEVTRLSHDPELPPVAVLGDQSSPAREAALLAAGSYGTVSATDPERRESELLRISHQLGLRQTHRARLAHAERALDVLLGHKPEAAVDLITRLPLRTRFTAELVRSPSEAAVLCFDLRGFQAINDALGHHAGDALLRVIALRLEACRPVGSFLARIGCDEFGLLLPTSPGGASLRTLTDGILRRLTGPTELAHQRIYPRFSVGIASGHDGAGDLLHAAQAALSQAKRHEADAVVLYSPTHSDSSRSQVQLESELRQALDAGEFTLHYQPIVHLETGTVRSFEALLRWNHPTRGLLAPGTFIAFAERSGLIREIGAWVLKTAVRDAVTWRSRHPELARAAVNVNLSAFELPDPDLFDRVAHVLATEGLPPEALRFELTETAAMSRIEPYLGLLERLRAHGVALQLDDFGMGYATLEHLLRLPISVLKVDRSFLVGTGSQQRSREVMEAIAHLGRRLGLRVVAEGIETEAQLQYLRRIGIGHGQGYWFCRPVPLSAFGALIERLPLPTTRAPSRAG
jgi:diguanylate cyclase (GGDEF)-like protein